MRQEPWEPRGEPSNIKVPILSCSESVRYLTRGTLGTYFLSPPVEIHFYDFFLCWGVKQVPKVPIGHSTYLLPWGCGQEPSAKQGSGQVPKVPIQYPFVAGGESCVG